MIITRNPKRLIKFLFWTPCISYIHRYFFYLNPQIKKHLSILEQYNNMYVYMHMSLYALVYDFNKWIALYVYLYLLTHLIIYIKINWLFGQNKNRYHNLFVNISKAISVGNACHCWWIICHDLNNNKYIDILIFSLIL